MIAAGTSLVLSEDASKAWASILILAILGLSPVFSSVLICVNKKNLHKPSMQKKIGSLYAGCKHAETNTWQLALSSIFLSRRVFFVALTFCFPQQPAL
jgi:hypothetical protein